MPDDPRLLSEEEVGKIRSFISASSGAWKLLSDRAARIERIAALERENGELREAIEEGNDLLDSPAILTVGRL